MAAQGKKQEKSSCAEQLAQVMQSMKGKPLPADFDELETPLRADILEELHRKLKKLGEN